MTVISSRLVASTGVSPLKPVHGDADVSKPPRVYFGGADPVLVLREGETEDEKALRALVFKWFLTLAIVFKGISASGMLVNLAKQAQKPNEVKAPPRFPQNDAAYQQIYQQVAAAYFAKIPVRRKALVDVPQCTTYLEWRKHEGRKLRAYCSLLADVDWQVIPGSKLEKEMRLFMKQSIRNTAREIYLENFPAGAGKKVEGENPVLPVVLDQAKLDRMVEQTLSRFEDRRSSPKAPCPKVDRTRLDPPENDGYYDMPVWHYHLHKVLKDRFHRLSQKDVFLNLSRDILLHKRFQEEFLNGGIDYEGKPLPSIEQDLAENGIQLHAIRLKALRESFTVVPWEMPLGKEKVLTNQSPLEQPGL